MRKLGLMEHNVRLKEWCLDEAKTALTQCYLCALPLSYEFWHSSDYLKGIHYSPEKTERLAEI